MLKELNKNQIVGGIVAIVLIIAGLITGAAVNINIENGKIDASITYAEEEIPATLYTDKGEAIETTEYNGEEIPTVDEVDGGMFEDKDTGVSTIDGEYEDLGAAIETFDVSTPEIFRDQTLGKCIYANNRYGAQCVSLARSFWWSYANRDVSTCGTGMAKGMMNCADQNAGDDFLVFWGHNGIQSGDWLVFDGGQYGHVGMALGPVVNGYVALLGENQGGKACDGGGAATNIINISVKNLIGYYRPKIYIAPEPEPTPEPTPEPVVDKCKVWNVKKGDTMAKIMQECEGKVKWGAAMNEYAEKWISTKAVKNQSVYTGWASVRRVGLFAGDVIEYQGK